MSWSNRTPKNTAAVDGGDGSPWPAILALLIVPLGVVAAHLLWPDSTLLKWIANMVALLVGAVYASVLHENLQGITRFSLPLSSILIVVLVGGALAPSYGWSSTGIVLASYALWCIVSGLVMRHSSR